LYTVIASLYLASDWALPGNNRQLWIAGSVAVLVTYGLVLLLDLIRRPRVWQPPPKTGDLDEVNKYAERHIAVRDGKNRKAVPVWRVADFYRDPAWYGFAFLIATSVGILAMTGSLASYWPVPVAGVLLTLLTGWIWLRVSKTFMMLILSYAKYG
jgi:hypothetical protein